jgi:hypothetical protein
MAFPTTIGQLILMATVNEDRRIVYIVSILMLVYRLQCNTVELNIDPVVKMMTMTLLDFICEDTVTATKDND